MNAASIIRFSVAVALLLGFSLNQAAAQVTTPRTCSKSAFFDNGAGSASSTQQLVPVTSDRYAGNTIYICGYAIASNSAVNINLLYGTGTACGTGPVQLTPAWRFATNTAGLYSIVDGQATWRGLEVPAGQNLCVTWSGTGTPSVQIIVYYDNNPL